MHSTAVSIARSVRSGEQTATEVVIDALERIAAANSAVNAFVEVRAAEALQESRTLDARIRSGEDPGPLAGVPVAVKDSLWERGKEATAGSRSLLGFRPPATSEAVKRLTAAGAIVVGRTNLPEFCYRGDCSNDLYGVTSNPADSSRTAGGSSGGSAAAVGAGMVPLALGSDGGGSIRIPASFCGTVGFKPTFGRVPRMPGFHGWYTLNHVGPLTSTVADAALAYDVLHGPDGRDAATLPRTEPSDKSGSSQAVSQLKIAYSEDLGYVKVDDEVRRAFRRAVDKFAEWGASVVEASPPLANPLEVWNTLSFVDNLASEEHLLNTGLVGDDSRVLIEAGRAFTGADYARARNEQNEIAAAWDAFMSDFDLLLTPTMECVSFPHGTTAPRNIGGHEVVGFDDDWCHFSYPFDLSGQPAISVPLPSIETSLPMGLQIVGRRFDDELVLDVATEWEKRVDWSPSELNTYEPPIPPELLKSLGDAIAADGSEVAFQATESPIVAGQRIELDGATVHVRRSYSSAPGAHVVEFEQLQ